jgi:hypothetical protein
MNIQVPINEDTAFGRYQDAIYYDEALWSSWTPSERETNRIADTQTRVDAWISVVTTTPTITLEEAKLRRRQLIRFAYETAQAAGIPVVFGAYGTLILAPNDMPAILRDAQVADYAMRVNAANRNTNMDVTLADDSKVTMPMMDVIDLVLAWTQVQRQLERVMRDKLRAVNLAVTITEVNAIEP